MTDTATPTIYRIPATNFLRLEGEIAKMNKRAVKLDCPPVVLTVVRVVTEKRKDQALGFEYDFTIHECTVEGVAPKLADWTMVAAVEPVTNGEMLVREVPGQTCPAEYRTTDLRCDHCNSIRRRNAIYVLRHDQHGHKQVGRNCLADFLRTTNPESLLAGAEYLLDFSKMASDAEDEGWGMGGKRPERVVPTAHFVAAASVVMRKLGWVARSAARDDYDGQGPEATANIAWRICTQPEDKYTKEMIVKHGLTVADGDVERAEAALCWGRAIDPDNAASTYLHDLGVCCRQEYVVWKTGGYVASVLGAHNRALAKELAAKAVASTSPKAHVGKVKERSVFDLTIVGTHPYSTDFGPKVLVRFNDDRGNVLVWRASGSPEWVQIGRKLSVKATVKAHDEYQGVPQTVLERAVPHGESVAA